MIMWGEIERKGTALKQVVAMFRSQHAQISQGNVL
jgi:hypothetical protein